MLSLPQEFLQRAKQFTKNEFDSFIESLSQPAPVSIRFNPNKKCNAFDNAEIIPWSAQGRYLDQRPSFTADPLFHAGCYYVQEASSQFLEQAFLQIKKEFNHSIKILDLCAAPGGKSTHILSLIAEDDLLVSNEVVASRNTVLRHNIIKWGCSNGIVTQNDTTDFQRLNDFFDVIIVDAPCSGEGLFRKQHDAMDEWSVENVNKCCIRQEEILTHAASALKPGGYLIYSTCTYEEIENDKQMEYLIEKGGMKNIPVEDSIDGIVRTKYGLAFFPHKIRGEGFYISVVQKSGTWQPDKPKSSKQKKNHSNNKLIDTLQNPDHYLLLEKQNRMFGIPIQHMDTFNSISENLYVRYAGIYIGETKGKDLIPSEALALSVNITENFPTVDLSKEKALEFLRGGNPSAEYSKGWNLVAYQNHKIGWVKNLGNRINNYYPKEWRIKNV